MRSNNNGNPGKLQRSSNSKHSNTSSSQSISNQLTKNKSKPAPRNSHPIPNLDEPQIKSLDEYFNGNKINTISKKTLNNPGIDPSTKKLISRNEYEYHKFQKADDRKKVKDAIKKQKQISQGRNQEQQLHKLKFTLPRAVIGFDGKVTTFQPVIVKSRNNESRSTEQYTQFVKNSSRIKVNQKKAKSKSLSKKKKTSQKSRSKSKSKNKAKKIKQKAQSNKFKQGENQKLGACSSTQAQSSSATIFPHIPNYDLSSISTQIKHSKQTIPFMKYLKKLPKQTHSQYLNLISKFCHELKLSKTIFFRSIQLIDRYLNEQLVIVGHKVKLFAIASLNICIKYEDRQLSEVINQSVYEKFRKFGSIQEKFSEKQKILSNQLIQQSNTKQKYKNTKKAIENQKKLSHQMKISQIIATASKLIEQQFNVSPDAEQIFQCEILMLLKQQFKLPSHDLAYWIDLITLAWDTYLINVKNSSIPNTFKILFRNQESPQNYFLLTQIVQQTLHSVQLFYSFTFPQIILSLIFLTTRIQFQQKQRIQQTFNYYRTNLQKSNNCLFIDKHGTNQIFSNFLQNYGIQMGIGDILACCKFVSCALNDSIQIISKSKWKMMNCGVDEKMLFLQHFWNDKFKHL